MPTAISVETSQYTLALVDEKFRHEDPVTGVIVTGKQILDQLRKNRAFLKDDKGAYVSLRFSGQEFKFRAGNRIKVGESVGHALQRSSAILVGDLKDALSNPQVPFLTIVDRSILGEEVAAPTVCAICNKDLETMPRLARHFDTHRKTHPEFFRAEKDEVPEETVPEGADLTTEVTE